MSIVMSVCHRSTPEKKNGADFLRIHVIGFNDFQHKYYVFSVLPNIYRLSIF